MNNEQPALYFQRTYGLDRLLASKNETTYEKLLECGGKLTMDQYMSLVGYRKLYLVMKDKYGNKIYEGMRFRFKLMEVSDRTIDLIGYFRYKEDELIYEIVVHDNPNYKYINYIPNRTTYDFELI